MFYRAGVPLLVAAITLPAQLPPSHRTNSTGIEEVVTHTVERAREVFNVPGISVAIVKDGRVVLAKGYGVRRLGSAAPMTANTLAGIASNTKAFTAAALAMLVDEGKLSWEDRVIDRLPEFAMSDPYVTREMRIRDLACHRSGLGLGAGDLMYFPRSDLSTADIVYRLRFVPLAHGFRAQYAYNNILYHVIGAVVAKVSGKPWEEFIRDSFFVPLGMSSSRTSIRQIDSTDEVVSPHATLDGELKPLQDPPPNVGAGGAIVSSALDMTRWLLTLLNSGVTPDGKTLISEPQLKTLWTPLIFIDQPHRPGDPEELKSSFAAYAMGEVISEYRGRLMVSHTGGLPGIASVVTMLPDQNLGLVILSNQQEILAAHAIRYTILDHYLGGGGRDWVATALQRRAKLQENANNAVAAAHAKRNTASKPSLPSASYAGRYRDSWYGDVVVAESGGTLTMRFSHSPGLTGTMEHWQYDTFVVRWKDRSLDADAYVTFQLSRDGKVETATMAAISPLTDFSYDFHDLRLVPVSAETPHWD